jgi:mono/diheme cytochrome c family protein
VIVAAANAGAVRRAALLTGALFVVVFFGAASAQDGAAIYQAQCASCHQPDGEGLGEFPPLAGSDRVLGEPHPLVAFVLDGQGAMPPFRNILDDEELAAVLSHVRTNFGNDAEPIEAEVVAEVRDEPADDGEPEPADDAEAGGKGEAEAESEAEGEAEGEPEGEAEGEPEGEAEGEPEGESEAATEADAEADGAADAAEAVVVDLPEDWFDQGAAAYLDNCSACHQPAGQGIEGAFPPLAGNAFVQGQADAVIRLVLHGRAGMPAFGGNLDNETIALIVSYIRNAWDNEAHPVDASMVETVRGGGDLELEPTTPTTRPGAGN